jgi:hypothetical protein
MQPVQAEWLDIRRHDRKSKYRTHPVSLREIHVRFRLIGQGVLARHGHLVIEQ